MTKPPPDSPAPDADQISRNITRIANDWQKLIEHSMKAGTRDATPPIFDPAPMARIYTEMALHLMNNPEKLVSSQMTLIENYAKLFSYYSDTLLGRETQPVVSPDPKDRRFKDTAWKESAFFDFIKQSYLLTSDWAETLIGDIDGMEKHEARKLAFYTRQYLDAVAPSNFLFTNPEALRETLNTNGENLVRGMQNLLEDMERGNGRLDISTTDYKAFELGRNIAATPGKVVFRNDLIELIQYEAMTEKVFKTPVLLMPAWINKYYILDLQEKNSLIRWLVSQGHTVFVISWINPDERHRDKGFEDYMLEGPLAALDAIEQATGEKQASVIGYCLGGTLLSITLAWLKAKKQAHRIASATYLTTMVDFTDAGDLEIFIDEEQLSSLEQRMSGKGYLDGHDMAITFYMLRANDLIWSFVVNNYLLGKAPFPFDLLYWNADATRMPAKMHSFYLRNMYQRNLLAKAAGITVAGVPIDLSTIETPSYLLSTREDHIAPWQTTYLGARIYKGPVRFVLAASGHVAGVINPPGKDKYGYWASDTLPATADDWLEMAKEVNGSWWPDWHAWQQQFAGPQVPARKPGSGRLKPLGDAPGEYVRTQIR